MISRSDRDEWRKNLVINTWGRTGSNIDWRARCRDLLSALDAADGLNRAAEAHLDSTALDGPVQSGTWIALQAALAAYRERVE